MKKVFPYFSLFCFYFLIGWASFLLGQKITVDDRPIEQHFVSISLPGRLGNHMFSYATGLAYALEHDKELVVTSNTSLLHNAFDIDINDKYDENFPIWKNLEKKNISHTGSVFYESPTFIPLDNPNYIHLDGYFQNEKYFKKHKKDILKAFNFNKPTDDKNKALIEKIKKTNAVSLHVRRGDYLNKKNIQSVLSLYYYKNAVDYIRKHVQNPHFFIFSDDIKWAKENLQLTWPHTFVDINNNVNDYIDMYLMSLCDHNIIANSTFSWWGAWLNQHKDKIVIAPDVWLKNNAQFGKNIIPSEWIVLPNTADIAILYIATGRYIVFFDEFYQSMEKNFLPQHNKTYFVWTDSTRNFPDNVVKIPTENLGWPYATLYRFKLFQNEWDKLQHFDYMYYLNANISVVQPVNDEILPTQKQGIMATLHPGYYNRRGAKPYDRNPKSLAYIPDISTPPPHKIIFINQSVISWVDSKAAQNKPIKT